MNNIIIKQFEVSDYKNFTYILACNQTKNAAMIDAPEKSEIVLDFIKEHNLNLKYIFNTHNHNDHIANNDFIKSKTNAQILMHYLDNKSYKKADILIEDDTFFNLGHLKIKIIHTPGHTPGGICFYINNHLFTGDTLFVGDSGRTDLPEGNRNQLGISIRKLMELPDETIVYPGHNYGITPASTIIWEKKNNINATEYGFAI